MTAIGCRPKPGICFLPGRLRWTFLPKDYVDSLSGRGPNTQPSNWEADTLTLSYRRPNVVEMRSSRSQSLISCTKSLWRHLRTDDYSRSTLTFGVSWRHAGNEQIFAKLHAVAPYLALCTRTSLPAVQQSTVKALFSPTFALRNPVP